MPVAGDLRLQEDERLANSLGEVVHRFVPAVDAERRPAEWVLEIAQDDGSTVLLAGAAHEPRRMTAVVGPEKAKASVKETKLALLSLLGLGSSSLERGRIVLVTPFPRGPGSHLAYLLAQEPLANMSVDDLRAVGLHANEVGLDPEDAARTVLARSPDLHTTPDPHSFHERYPDWVHFLSRLKELGVALRSFGSPIPALVESYVSGLAEAWATARDAPWAGDIAAWPAELRVAAKEYGFL